MAENTADKETLKAAKEAEKAAQKAKQERIKQSKPKKEGNVFSRAVAAIKKFFKDFIGTVKKIVWPTGAVVLKNSVITLAVILVIGLVVYGIDQGLTALIGAGSNLAVSAGEALKEDETEEESTEAEETAADEETTAAEETAAEETVAEETNADEETTAAEETTLTETEETTAA